MQGTIQKRSRCHGIVVSYELQLELYVRALQRAFQNACLSGLCSCAHVWLSVRVWCSRCHEQRSAAGASQQTGGMS
eukprot:6205664-Pleurochrysis_carterae.AAC.3